MRFEGVIDIYTEKDWGPPVVSWSVCASGKSPCGRYMELLLGTYSGHYPVRMQWSWQ